MTTPNGPEATIIPFPVRARAAAPAAGQDHERLSRLSATCQRPYPPSSTPLPAGVRVSTISMAP